MILKDFIEESKKRGVILAQPVHGKHSKEPVSHNGVILVDPVHGKHSRPVSGNKGHKVNEAYQDQYAKSPEGHEHYIDFGNKNYNDHMGEHVEHVHKALDLPQHKFEENPHSSALKRYSVSSFHINNSLIRKAGGRSNEWEHSPYDSPKEKELKDRKKARFESDVHDLDNSFKHPSARLNHDLHVFHGTTKFNPGEEAAKNGGRIHLPAYTSTSINARNALDFADAGQSHSSHVIHIHMKKGQHGHYLGSNSEVPEEQELLLPRNTTLRIHPKPTILHSGAGSSKKTHVWHAHIED